MDEGSGTTIADTSGNDNAGTLTNGRVRVNDSNALDLTTAATFEAWEDGHPPASTRSVGCLLAVSDASHAPSLRSAPRAEPMPANGFGRPGRGFAPWV